MQRKKSGKGNEAHINISLLMEDADLFRNFCADHGFALSKFFVQAGFEKIKKEAVKIESQKS